MTLFFLILTLLHIAQLLLAIGTATGIHWCYVVFLIVTCLMVVIDIACLLTFFLTDKELERMEP